MDTTATVARRGPWNKGKLVGQKAPLKAKDIWAIRVRLQIQVGTRDLALFDLGIDSKLRGCDLVKLGVRDVCQGGRVASRPIVLHQKTQGPVQFEIRPATRLLRYGRRRQGARLRGWRIVELRDQPLIAPLLHNNRAARRTGRGHLAVLRPFGLPFTSDRNDRV